jgi:hypothetical protein
MKRKKKPNEAQHVEASLSFLLPNEFEEPVQDVHASTPPTHEDNEMVTIANGLVRESLHMVDEHIDTFIQTGRWDFGRLIFDRDPIYDNEGSPQEKGLELSSSEDYFSCVHDSSVWDPDDDMIIDLFEDSQPLLSSVLEEHKDMATSERPEAHSTKRKHFHIEDFYRDSKIKRARFFLPRPKLVPYLIFSSGEIMRSS